MFLYCLLPSSTTFAIVASMVFANELLKFWCANITYESDNSFLCSLDDIDNFP